MKLRLASKIFLSVIVCALIVFAPSLSKAQSQSTVDLTATVTNVCSSQTVSIQSVAWTSQEGSTSIQFVLPATTIAPGASSEFSRSLTFTPAILTLSGAVGSSSFTVQFDPLLFNVVMTDEGLAQNCLEVIVSTSGTTDDGGTVQPPTGSKPVAEGQSMEQVLAALAASGFQISQDGSQTNPKIGNVADPQLLRMSNAFTAQVIWVSAPGQLRSVINWDNPNVDLDLLVFGVGACFQLNGTGILAEVCDRFPTGPVPGAVFAVIVINWSVVNQPFVLSLSS